MYALSTDVVKLGHDIAWLKSYKSSKLETSLLEERLDGMKGGVSERASLPLRIIVCHVEMVVVE